MTLQSGFGIEKRHMPEIMQIVRAYTPGCAWVRPGTRDEDLHYVADLVTNVGNFGVRVRLPDAWHYQDVTVRFNGRNNGISEYHKIKAGRGDYMIYGWTDEFELDPGVRMRRVWDFVIVNFGQMRRANILDQYSGPYNNKGADDHSQLVAYSLDLLRKHNCLIVDRIPVDTMRLYKFGP